MQVVAQFFKLKAGEETTNQRTFRILTGIDGKHLENLEFFEEILNNVFENYLNIQSVITNSFDIEMIFLS